MRGQMSRHCGRNWLSGICMAFLCILLMQGNAHAAGRTGDFTVKGGSYGTDYSYADHVLTVLTDTPLTISGESVSDSIQVKKDIEASVTLDNVIIRSRNCPLDIQNATVTLKFKGDVSLKGGIKQPGIAVGKDGKLSLSGGKNDTLTASGGSRAAGGGRMIRIREMEAGDVDAAALLEQQIFSRPWSRQGFLDALEMDNTIFLVAEERGTVSGYAGLYAALDEGEITNVAVDGKRRCRGTGWGVACFARCWGRWRPVWRLRLFPCRFPLWFFSGFR